MDTDTLEAMGGGKSSSHKEICDVPSSYGSISMEEEVIDASVLLSSDVCNRAQFWGAVGIFIEKPHILNRRLCGVADLWWGKLSLPKTDKVRLEATVPLAMYSKPLASVAFDNTIPKFQDTLIQEGFTFENLNANGNLSEEQEGSECSVAKAHNDSSRISVDINTLNNLDNLMLKAWKLLQCYEGQHEGVCSEKDLQRIDTFNSNEKETNSNGRTSLDEKKLLGDLKNLLRNCAFEDIPIIEGDLQVSVLLSLES